MKLLLLSLALLGCGPSIVHLNPAEPLAENQCKVIIHSSKEEALKNGPIIERVLISGTSSGSFSHTVGTAVNKHKDWVCEYGADQAYIQAQDPGTLGTASVTLVGFSYKKQ